MTSLSSTIPASVHPPVKAREPSVSSQLQANPNTTANTKVAVPIDGTASGNAPSAVHNVNMAAETNYSTDMDHQEHSDSAASDEDLENAVIQLKEYLQKIDRNLDFSIDKDSGRTVVKVIDATTEEVIRQIPSDDIIRMSKNLEDASGLLVDARA